MKFALLVLGSIGFSILSLYKLFGFWPTYLAAYGSLAMMAFFVSASFLWLWVFKKTPLALGMAMSWGGAFWVFFWFWLYSLFDHPAWMIENPVLFVFLSIYISGALLHFMVLNRTFEMPRWAFLGLVAIAFFVPSLVVSLI